MLEGVWETAAPMVARPSYFAPPHVFRTPRPYNAAQKSTRVLRKGHRMRKPRDPDDVRMSFGDHIEDLRRRLIYTLLGVFVIFCFTLYYGRTISNWLYQPLIETLRYANLPAQLYTRASLGGLTVYMKVSLYAALIMSAPWILYQIWRFVEGGLYATERRAVMVLVGLSSVMTACALVFVYYLLLPAVLTFLILFTTTYPESPAPGQSFLRSSIAYFYKTNTDTLFLTATTRPTTPPPATSPHFYVPAFNGDPPLLPGDPPLVEGQMWYNTQLHEFRGVQQGHIHIFNSSPDSIITPLIDPNEYLSEALWLTFITVLVFHVPVVMTVLGMTGLIHPDTLSKRRKIIVIGLFIAALFLTPSQDWFSNIVLPLIAWFLFEIGLLLMRFFYRRAHANDEPEEPATPDAA